MCEGVFVYVYLWLSRWLSGERIAYNVGDTGDVGSIPGLERSPGGGNGSSLQYSSLENFMGRGAWRATVHGWGSQRVRHE